MTSFIKSFQIFLYMILNKTCQWLIAFQQSLYLASFCKQSQLLHLFVSTEEPVSLYTIMVLCVLLFVSGPKFTPIHPHYFALLLYIVVSIYMFILTTFHASVVLYLARSYLRENSLFRLIIVANSFIMVRQTSQKVRKAWAQEQEASCVLFPMTHCLLKLMIKCSYT